MLGEPPPERPVVPELVVDEDDAGNANDVQRAQRDLDDWGRNNRRLYGALLTALPAWLTTSMHLNHPGDGIAALHALRDRFGAADVSDRASAINRLQSSHIDSRADLSEDDLRLQYDQMMVAHADIQRAGGAAVDDGLLISMFDNSLPQGEDTVFFNISQTNREALHLTSKPLRPAGPLTPVSRLSSVDDE